MNSGATAERVFEALKRRIMVHEFRPGDRLDPALLAGELASSVTPVRDALCRLTGEGLVETRMGSGFFLPALDEPQLKDLYEWSAELIFLAIRSWPRAEVAVNTDMHNGTIPIADRAAGLFLAIGQLSTNSEHAQAIARLNAQLHAVRSVEPRVLHHLDKEFDEWVRAAAVGDRSTLRRLCSAYLRRRNRIASEIVRAVYRA